MAGLSQGGASNVDLFDAYFRRADLDRDGRVNGGEAVAFFQGSNLPKNVLAQIWNYVDQNRTGYLGRAEFYNALRLVTVAQSKRELTPDIVKAALYTPASAKIPAPQINLSATTAPQSNAVETTSLQGGPTTLSSQNPAFRAVSPQNASMGQQYNMSLANQSVRPSQPMPGGSVHPMPSITSQGFSGPGSSFGSNLSTSGMQMNSDVRTSGALAPVGSQVTNRGINPPATQAGIGSGLVGPVGPLPPGPPGSSGMMPSTSVNIEPRAHVSQNGFALFGDDAFSATSSQVKKDAFLHTSSSTSVPVSSGLVPVSGSAHSSVNRGSLGSLQNSLTVQQVGGQLQRVQSVPKQNQQVSVQRPSGGPGLPPPVPAPSQPQQQWPRMTQSDVQKYTKVFVEVDTDKDGKITGVQARNLFLSWKLPREVLKQVWDLSDQDNDSMLSLREFCIALYLMERYREGRSLPSVLPNNIMYDMPATALPTGGHGPAAWGYAPGSSKQAIPGSGVRHIPRPSGKPPLPVPAAHADERSNSKQQKPKVPVLEKHLVDQLSEEEQKNLNSKFQEATEANKNVEELEKEIKESREKMDFCRAKMQELVLYKSRCENRLNEITARVAADKREVELLANKYEEKYRETGNIASKLTLEEATFRDIQERKMELYRAIFKLKQVGSNDENLKDHVEHIQSDVEELGKSLNERCKKYGLRGKPTTILELPFGWQPGIQEGAADWDEDWDKFEDEGFTFVKEFTLDVQNIIAPPKTKTQSAKKEKSFNDESEKAAAASDAEAQTEKAEAVFKEAVDSEAKAEKHSGNGVVKRLAENGSAHKDHDPVSAKSPMGSPAARNFDETPQVGFRNNNFDKVFADSSPQAKEAKSDHGGFDGPDWGSFENNDDVDSVRGFNAVSNSKDNDDLFGPGGVALNPIKTGSSFGDSNAMKKGSSVFADSVPSTPLFPPSYSPRKFNEGPDDHLGPAFSRFDSFRSTESGFQPSGTLAHFDSMKSTKDFDYGAGFPSFDDSDPFGSGPFRSSPGTETPHSEVDPFGSRSFRLSLGSETPRSEVDPFGAGRFRSTFGSDTPRRDSDPFGPSSVRSSFGSETPRRELDSFGAGQFKSSFGSETPRSEYDGFGSVGPFKSLFGSETPRSDWMGGETPRSGDFDSFGYSGPFRSSMGSETPRSDLDPFGSSGPFRSSLGDETPRRDSDPFGGSGPFKSSFANETPRGGTYNWSAF